MKAKGGKRPGAGRKPGSPNKVTAEIKALAQQHTAASMKELARIALKGTSDTARVAAIREIFDRGFGRAPQSINAGGDGGGLIVKVQQFAGVDDG